MNYPPPHQGRILRHASRHRTKWSLLLIDLLSLRLLAQYNRSLFQRARRASDVRPIPSIFVAQAVIHAPCSRSVVRHKISKSHAGENPARGYNHQAPLAALSAVTQGSQANKLITVCDFRFSRLRLAWWCFEMSVRYTGNRKSRVPHFHQFPGGPETPGNNIEPY